MQLLEHVSRDFITEEILKFQGAAVAIYLLSVVLPLLGLFPRSIMLPMFIIFSIPLVYVYILSVLMNKHISVRKHLLLTSVASYLLYIMSLYPFASAKVFYTYTLFFLIGGGIAFATYSLHYLFYRIGKSRRMGVERVRTRFIVCFVPTILIMLLLSWVVSIFAGGFLFGLEESLTAVANGGVG